MPIFEKCFGKAEANCWTNYTFLEFRIHKWCASRLINFTSKKLGVIPNIVSDYLTSIENIP